MWCPCIQIPGHEGLLTFVLRLLMDNVVGFRYGMLLGKVFVVNVSLLILVLLLECWEGWCLLL